MELNYPFDPYDWSTITPLFEALNLAPVSQSNFADWLEEWNQLDIAVYDAWTELKRRSYSNTTDAAAEQAYLVYTREVFSTYLGLTNTLAARALTLQPEPPTPSHTQLWRRWQNQTTLFNPESLALQAELSELEGGYRGLMRRIEQQGGDSLAHWMEQRSALNELMLRMLNVRRELARMSGVSTFLAFHWRELNRLDWSIEECQQFHSAVEQIVVPIVKQLRAIPRKGTGWREVHDTTLLKNGVQRILANVHPAFGDIFGRMYPNYLDLGTRRGKAVTSEQWFFPRTGMPYLHVDSTNPATLLHESGHAIHAYLSFQAQQSLWNFAGPEEFQEFIAIGMDMLAWPYYEQKHDQLYNAAESIIGRQNVLRFYLEGMVHDVMEDAFEHWIYGQAPEDVTPEQIDMQWLQFKRRFKPWEDLETDQQVAMTGWQRWNWSLFRMPLYTIAYPVAIVGVCQLALQAQQSRTTAVDNYMTALAPGNTKTLPELFGIAGVTFPFTYQAVEEAAQFAYNQYLQLDDSQS